LKKANHEYEQTLRQEKQEAEEKSERSFSWRKKKKNDD